MLLKRSIDVQVDEYLQGQSYKTLFIWGPRRSGKTTLLKRLSKELNVPFFNFDYQSDRELFLPKREILEKLVSTHKVILIDEVQNFPESTVALKLLYDDFNVKVIATGSSELRQKANQKFDTMAGRFIETYCLPLSIEEIADNTSLVSYEKERFFKELQAKLQIFGAYPEIYVQKKLSEAGKIDLLEKILDTYVLKDVIEIYDLKNEKLARDILTKIALQLGSEVSIREIAISLNANQITVSNYIEIFIKNYILIPLPSFRTNVRKAVSDNRKLYFYDLGIRNILVKDFRDLELRPDKGGVFENFIVSEIEKQRKNNRAKLSLYFYREYGGKEVDLIVEDYKKNYKAVEIKTTHGNVKNIFPLPSRREIINAQNYFEKISAITESN
ncbi:MAG: ATP-binding protein [Patescibacteria group bacterium]